MKQLAILVIGFFLSSCASILSRSLYQFPIEVNPPRTQIVVKSINEGEEKVIFEGLSPSIVPLQASRGYFKKASYIVELTAPGYEKKVIPVTSKVDGLYWGNFLIGGLIGFLIIDPLTGAMFQIEERAIMETLSESAAANSQSPALKIIDYNSIEPVVRNSLIELK